MEEIDCLIIYILTKLINTLNHKIANQNKHINKKLDIL